MEYAVVCFENQSVSEIPFIWIIVDDKNGEYWWPPPNCKNISSLIRNKPAPDSLTKQK